MRKLRRGLRAALAIIAAASGVPAGAGSLDPTAFAPTLVGQDDFTGSNGQALSARLNGWTVSGGSVVLTAWATIQSNNANLNVPTANTGVTPNTHPRATMDAGSANHRVECSWPTIGLRSTLIFRDQGDGSNFFMLQRDSGTLLRLYAFTTANGGTKNAFGGYINIPAGVLVDNVVVAVEVVDTVVSVYAGPPGALVRYGAGAFGGAPFDGTIDISTSGLLTGTRGGLSSPGTNNVRADNFAIYSLNPPLTINSYSTDFIDNEPIVHITGTYTGTAPSGLDIEIKRRSNNQVIVARAAATVLQLGSGTFTIAVQSAALRAFEGQTDTLKAVAWKPSPSTVGLVQNFDIPIYASILPMKLGMNECFQESYELTDVYRDKAMLGHWRAPGATPTVYLNMPNGAGDADAGVDWNGTVHYYPSGATQLNLYLPFFTHPDRLGTYDIYYPASMTCIKTNGPTLTEALTGGHGAVDISSTSYGAWYLSLSGTIPPEGLTPGDNIRVVKRGDANPSRIHVDETVAEHEAVSSISRFMTGDKTNQKPGSTIPLTDATVWAGNKSKASEGRDAPLTLDLKLDWCRAAGADLHITLDDNSYDGGGTYEREIADRIVTYIQSTGWSGRILVEVSNETWNSAEQIGFGQFYRYMVRGIREGLHGGTAYPTCSDQRANIDGVTLVASVAYTAGDIILMAHRGSGWYVYEVLNNTTIGAVLPSSGGSNSNFALRVGNADTERCRWRAHIRHERRAFAAFRDAFSAAGMGDRITTVHGEWFSAGAAKIIERLTWEDHHLYVDRYALGNYWSGADKLGDLSNQGHWSDDTSSGFDHPDFTQTEKGLYATDLPAYLDAWFGVSRYGVDVMIAKIKAIKHDVERGLRLLGNYVPQSVQMMSYECGQHYIWRNYPDHALATTAAIAVMNDQRHADDEDAFRDGLLHEIGAEHCWFGMQQSFTTPGSGGEIRQWAVINEGGDITNPRFIAAAAWKLANSA